MNPSLQGGVNWGIVWLCACKWEVLVCLQTWDGPISGMDLDWTGLDWPVLTFDLQKATIANIPGRDESIMLFSSQYAFRHF